MYGKKINKNLCTRRERRERDTYRVKAKVYGSSRKRWMKCVHVLDSNGEGGACVGAKYLPVSS